MFERFTERARQVVVLAQEEARGLKHDYIGTEHILLGLAREPEGLASVVLANLGARLEEIRIAVTRIVGSGEKVTSGQIPFTPRAKKVLELALREALSLGHNYIGTEHILLGLVRENEGVAARILLDMDIDAERVRSEVLHMLSSGSAGEHAAAEGWQPGLNWNGARVRWTPTGPELVVPTALEPRAALLFGGSAAWGEAPLAELRHELSGGELTLSSERLLTGVDPRALRRALDSLISQAHAEAMRERDREGVLADAFLAALREQPAS